MKKILNNYFNANTWIVFIIIVVLYSIALTIELNLVFTDDFYLNSFEGKRSYDSIYNFISAERQSEWINYPVTLVIVLFPTLLIAFALNVGAIFNDNKIKFVNIFKTVIKAQMIFAINYLISTVLKWQGLIERDYGNINNNFDFQSLAYFFKNEEHPFWVMYPLQNINITELIFLLFLSYGFSWLTKVKYVKALGFVILFYGAALIVWIIFSVFLQTFLYN